MSFLSLARAQIGRSATAALNILLRTPDVPDGSLIVSKGTYDAPGTTLATFNADGSVSPTAVLAATENSQKVATTAWAKFGFVFVSTVANGYIKLPSWLGGFILQWLSPLNSNNLGGGYSSSAFPVAFPNQCFGAIATPMTAASKSYEAGFTCVVPAVGLSTVAWVGYLPNGTPHPNANFIQAFIVAIGH